jgi:hypothetical protein
VFLTSWTTKPLYREAAVIDGPTGPPGEATIGILTGTMHMLIETLPLAVERVRAHLFQLPSQRPIRLLDGITGFGVLLCFTAVASAEAVRTGDGTARECASWSLFALLFCAAMLASKPCVRHRQPHKSHRPLVFSKRAMNAFSLVFVFLAATRLFGGR